MTLSFHTEPGLDALPESASPPDADINDRQAVRLWLRLLGCTHRLEQTLGQRLRRHFGTSLARFDYLAQLQPYPEGLRMKTLSRRLMVTGGNITGLTDQLLGEGFVTREVDPNDRRAHIVRITPLGLSTFECMAEAHRRWVGSLLAGVPDAERQLLHGLLGGLAQSLDAIQAQ